MISPLRNTCWPPLLYFCCFKCVKCIVELYTELWFAGPLLVPATHPFIQICKNIIDMPYMFQSGEVTTDHKWSLETHPGCILMPGVSWLMLMPGWNRASDMDQVHFIYNLIAECVCVCTSYLKSLELEACSLTNAHHRSLFSILQPLFSYPRSAQL